MRRRLLVIAALLSIAAPLPSPAAASAEDVFAGDVFEVVLGSYVDRNIALVELSKFSQCNQPLVVLPQKSNGTAMFRVVDGPYERFAEASIVRRLWLECGVEDAWVNKRTVN